MPEEAGVNGGTHSLADRKYLILEVGALCSTHFAVIAGRLLGVSGKVPPLYEAPHATYTILLDGSRLAIFLFVMYASGDPMSHFGLRKLEWKRDLTAFLVASVGVALIHGGTLLKTIHHAPLTTIFHTNLTPPWLLALLCAAIGVTEETMFRGYLLPRLEQLAGSTWIAVLGQAALFGCVHLYQGLYGVLGATLTGLLFGVIFARTRTIWPLALAHALLDFAITFQVMQRLTNG